MVGGDYPGPGPYTVGAEVAGYRLEERIGRGGMALVYRARDVQLGRNVALKLLPPVLGLDEAFRQRFIRESRAAAAVDHPNIIPIFAAGQSDGVLYIAMRYVQGGDVRQLIDRLGPLAAGRAISIITQVASALDAAHLHGLVHRDVKPANMLLDSTGDTSQRDHVYLTDFGLSKRSLSVTGLTSIGHFLGTPAYVAPEQVEGKAVDGRADQYALACTSFEMLSGSPPFERDDDLAIMWAQVSAPPPALSERRPDLPPAIDAVMGRALAKSAADRYPACLAFAAALRAALDPRGQPPGYPERTAGPPAAITRPSGGSRQVPHHPPAPEPETADVGQPAEPVPPTTEDPSPGPVAGPAGRVYPATEDWENPEQQPRRSLNRPNRPPSRPPNRPPAGPSNRGPGRGPRRRRSLWWPRGVIVVSCAVVVGLAIGAFTALHGGGKNQAASGTADTATSGASTPAAALAQLPAPGCRSTVARAPALGNVRAQSVTVGSQPFSVTTTADGRYTFVTREDAIVVLASRGGLAPAVDHVISLPGLHNGAVLTHDGKHLVAALNSGAVVLDVAAAEQGSSHAIVGTLTSSFGSGAVEVAISPDDQFVFVTLQNSADLAVFSLRTALSHGFGTGDVVGKVSLGQQPVGLAFSPDDRYLYATSMTTTPTQDAAEGTVTVIGTALAETTPAKAVKATAAAGCDPVRVIASGDGQTVWVTSRASDALLGFSASRLLSDPAHALAAQVDVGPAPIGETFASVGGQTRILVADSNLGAQSGAPSVAVIDPAKALRRAPALLGYASTGQVPRQFTIQPDGKTALVTDNGSGQLQAIDLSSLP